MSRVRSEAEKKATAERNKKRKAEWKAAGLCLSCGGARPCTKCGKSARKHEAQIASDDICLECIAIGFHRTECSRWKPRVRRERPQMKDAY